MRKCRLRTEAEKQAFYAECKKPWVAPGEASSSSGAVESEGEED